MNELPVRPYPGTQETQDQGCTCPVLDNHHGQGVPYPDGPKYWITEGCPLHDNKKSKDA